MHLRRRLYKVKVRVRLCKELGSGGLKGEQDFWWCLGTVGVWVWLWVGLVSEWVEGGDANRV